MYIIIFYYPFILINNRLTEEMILSIQDKIDEDCTITLGNLQASLRDTFGVEVSASTVDRAIDSFRYSLKRIQNIAIAADTPANEQLRTAFALWYLDKRLAGRTMIMVDETGFNLSMIESRGRSKKGERAQNRVPALRSRNLNVMAAMHNTGMAHYQILEGYSNAERFAHFLDDLAAQRDNLQLPADCIIILDNVGFHRSPIVVEMLQIRGFEYKYLPPYSPFFMGIESLFSEWKHHVKVGLQGKDQQLRTSARTCRRIL